MQLFEASRGIWLDDVEDRNRTKPASAAGQPDRHERERDEHAEHFVDDDRTRIDAAEIPFRVRGRPDARRQTRRQSSPPRPPATASTRPADRRRGPPRSHRPRRDRKVAAVADRGDEDGEAGHALTTRVSASAIVQRAAVGAEERHAESEPRPAAADTRYAAARTTAWPNDTRSGPRRIRRTRPGCPPAILPIVCPPAAVNSVEVAAVEQQQERQHRHGGSAPISPNVQAAHLQREIQHRGVDAADDDRVDRGTEQARTGRRDGLGVDDAESRAAGPRSGAERRARPATARANSRSSARRRGRRRRAAAA